MPIVAMFFAAALLYLPILLISFLQAALASYVWLMIWRSFLVFLTVIFGLATIQMVAGIF